MVEGVLQFDPAIIEALFVGVAFGGGIDRDEITFQGKTNQQVTGAKVPLNEHEILWLCIGCQPVAHGLEPGLQAGNIRRDVGPLAAQFQGWLKDAVNAQFAAGVLLLAEGKGMVEH